jgi:putative two-component system protein, hydrogenase maturation factor HypX/HoxX
MRVLLLCHAFNSLSQRVFAELVAAGHEVSVELDISDEVTRDAVGLFAPDVVVAPFLKRKIADEVWQAVPCLIVHPGPPGDRGANALDWAILDEESEWGVSVIRATGELDGGPIMAGRAFPMRAARKSSLYRLEVTEAAVAAVFAALSGLEQGESGESPPAGRWRDPVRSRQRRIDWQADDTATVLKKINSADGAPGVIDQIGSLTVRLFDARAEYELRGQPGELLARCGGTICRATSDGAVWLGHLRTDDKKSFKRAAVDVLGSLAADLPKLDYDMEAGRGPIRYREIGPVGVLDFDFYNGAMSAADCQALLAAWQQVRSRPVKVIVLAGGSDFWSNGMDLNAIEAADSPADESWDNINAMDDLAEAIVTNTDQLTVSALRGNAAAGGVFLALAADQVWARRGVVLNPHYKNMGNLYGSELWTYLLPRRVGDDGIKQVMGHRLPMLAGQAAELGLIDEAGPGDPEAFDRFVIERARVLAGEGWQQAIDDKKARRERDEADKSLAGYRAEELARMRLNFYGFDPSYHVARYRLVRRTAHAWTPLYLAIHRHRVGKAGSPPDQSLKSV